jgi:hypothetical protein
VSHQFKDFTGSLKIKLLNSSPYYAQANGQAESSNKILLKLIKKKVDEHPRRWHEVLSEALWAHRISRHGATKVTSFELVYGQEVVLPIEVNLQACRVARQNDLLAREYTDLMIDKFEEIQEARFQAMTEIEREKVQMVKAYNKKVRGESLKGKKCKRWRPTIRKLGGNHFISEIWFGKQFYRWGPRIIGLANGHLVGKDLIELWE